MKKIEGSKKLQKNTVYTQSYEEIRNILVSLRYHSHFIWILGKKGYGRTHMLHYIMSKYQSHNTIPIYIEISENITRIEDFLDLILKNLKKNAKHFPEIIEALVSDDLIENIQTIHNYNFLLLVDNDKYDDFLLKKIFTKGNQGLYERMINSNFYFFCTINPENATKLDDYFDGKKISIRPLKKLGQIRNFIREINKDYNFDPTIKLCTDILEKTGGIPAKIVQMKGTLSEDDNKLKNIQNAFVVENLKKIDSLEDKLKIGGFKQKLINWLDHFPSKTDKEIALKIANYTTYYDQIMVDECLKKGFNKLVQQIGVEDTWGEIIFSTLEDEPGTSGIFVTYRLRKVANLHKKQFKKKSEINSGNFGKIDDIKAVVFVDDIIGTGNQSIENFQEIYKKSFDIPFYLLVICAYEKGIRNIQRKTNLNVVCSDMLNTEKNIFSVKNTYFTEEEKERIKDLCVLYGKKEPLGYGDCGLCVVFEFSTPNNSISLIRECSTDFVGLFPRKHE